MGKYYAKSTSYSGDKVPAQVHCYSVAELAMRHAIPLGMGNIAYVTGLFHDFGKRSYIFQCVLMHTASGIDHASPGAAFLLRYYKDTGVIEVIAGHHAGLKNLAELEPYLKQILSQEDCATGPFGLRPSLSGKKDMMDAYADFSIDNPGFVFPKPERITISGTEKWKRRLWNMTFRRFLLSCLVDADYSVSAFESDNNKANLFSDTELCPDEAMGRLIKIRNDIKASSRASKSICDMRDMVYEDCGIAGQDISRSFWTLTAPTGAAKTMGMLKFALARCMADMTKKRIIFVMPFLSITDQTSRIVQEIIPDMIIDTSQVMYEGDNRIRSEKWDAPCVITTTVQFFGSLFSGKPGNCRKLHNLADSVIIFDEIQSLPSEVSRYAMECLHWISDKFHACVLLSTATQPAYHRLPELDWKSYEAIRDVKGCFSMAVQKQYEFLKEPVSLDEVAGMAVDYGNACVICNMKRHAKRVYDAWKDMGLTNVYLITTDLCPEHRLAIIQKIKDLQAAGEPVYVAATQCIEAGVDLDFKKVFRALGPLTAIIQAAGRQDRNGRFGSACVTVFEIKPEKNGERMYPDTDYGRQAGIVKTMVLSGYDMAGLDAVEEYYRRLYQGFQEPEKLYNSLMSLDYDLFEREARLIKKGGVQVVVPYEGRMDLYDEILGLALDKKARKRHIAIAAGITVQSYDTDSVSAYCQELVVCHGREEHHTGVYVLLDIYKDYYSQDTGLSFAKIANAVFM